MGPPTTPLSLDALLGEALQHPQQVAHLAGQGLVGSKLGAQFLNGVNQCFERGLDVDP
ncbi:hypothetical protein D3C72_2129520 [compost metagenome]